MSKELTISGNHSVVEQNQSSNGFMNFGNFNEAMKCAEMISTSDLCPEKYRGKPANVLIAIQHGLELGLKPMQALQNVAVIHGKPSIYGDALIAVCLASPVCDFIDESFDEATMTATCTAKRKNGVAQTETFSKKDAETAGLWNKVGPWKSYPKRMLKMRARSCLKDVFADILKGFISTEEAQDYVVIENPEARPNVSVKTKSRPQGSTVNHQPIDSFLQELSEGPDPVKIDNLMAIIKIGSSNPQETVEAILKKECAANLGELTNDQIDTWISRIENKMKVQSPGSEEEGHHHEVQAQRGAI